MKKVLIITYYWPPSGGAGVQRWLKFVKYLRGSGWDPVVYTPEKPEVPEVDLSLEKDIPSGITIIRRPIWEPYSYYKQFLGQKKEEKIQAAFLSEKKKNPLAEKISVWIRGNFFIPDARKFFIRPSVKFLKRYLEDHPVDLVVTTGPPHSMHLIGMKVAKLMSLPWLADFRDPWTGIDFYNDLRLTSGADKKHRRLEKEVLSNATAVTVISASMAKEFKGICDRNYEVITNGFDETDSLTGFPVVMDPKFSIAHIGTLTPSRNPIVLWETLKTLILENADFRNNLEIKLVGKVDHMVISDLESNGLTEFVTRREYLPHEEVMAVQRASQVLLLLINNTPNSGSILTGKLFEYLASERPILCIGPADGDAAAILEQTNSGKVSGFNDPVSVKQYILEFYNCYKQGTLTVNSRGIEKFSRKNLTVAMAGIMNRISGVKT
jgi:glycosyltransferase involved in cell wall biosynthesis